MKGRGAEDMDGFGRFPVSGSLFRGGTTSTAMAPSKGIVPVDLIRPHSARVSRRRGDGDGVVSSEREAGVEECEGELDASTMEGGDVESEEEGCEQHGDSG